MMVLNVELCTADQTGEFTAAEVRGDLKPI